MAVGCLFCDGARSQIASMCSNAGRARGRHLLLRMARPCKLLAAFFFRGRRRRVAERDLLRACAGGEFGSMGGDAGRARCWYMPRGLAFLFQFVLAFISW